MRVGIIGMGNMGSKYAAMRENTIQWKYILLMYYAILSEI